MSDQIQAADPASALRVAQEALAQALQAVGALERQLDAQGRISPVIAGRYRVNVAKPRAKDRGMWCLRIYGPGISRYGRRERTDIPHSRATKAKAEGLARRRAAELNDEGRTLLEVYHLWRESRVKLSRYTIVNHDSAQTWLESSGFAGLTDGELSAARVLAMRDELCASRKTSTAKLYLGFVKQAWCWAHNRELVDQAWPTGLPVWRAPVADRTKKRAYTPQELHDLLSYLRTYRDGHYFAFGWFLAESAARISAVRALRVGDVSLRPDGSADVALRVTKTGVERRAMVSPALAAHLNLDRPAEALLFHSIRSPERQVGRETFGKIVRDWLEERGLKGLRDVHSLRRRGACELTRANVPAEKGRRVTGHSSLEVYQSYAEKTDYDLTEERRILWINPEGIGAQRVPNTPGKPPQNGENGDMAPASTLRWSAQTGPGRTDKPLQPIGRAQSVGPWLRSLLLRRPALPYLPALLRTSFGGAAAE